MLSVTDNIVDGAVVRHDHTQVHDEIGIRKQRAFGQRGNASDPGNGEVEMIGVELIEKRLPLIGDEFDRSFQILCQAMGQFQRFILRANPSQRFNRSQAYTGTSVYR